MLALNYTKNQMEELEEDFKILIDAWMETERTDTEVLAKSLAKVARSKDC